MSFSAVSVRRTSLRRHRCYESNRRYGLALALLIGVALVAALGFQQQTAAAAPSGLPEGFVCVAREGYLTLYVRPVDGQIAVEDGRSAVLWMSNPVGVEMDTLSDAWRGNIVSPFYFEYSDESRNVRIGNLATGGAAVSYEPIDRGARMHYSFSNLGIAFAMEYELEEDCLVVTIPWSSVVANATIEASLGRTTADDSVAKSILQGPKRARAQNLFLLTIRPLPFLGATLSTQENGYMLVPDGSGGLIRFKEDHPLYQGGFQQWIYGYDPASADVTYDIYREPVALPVFGMKIGDRAFLAVVEDGSCHAEILAMPSGVSTDLNWTTVQFWYRTTARLRTARQGQGIKVYDEKVIPGDRRVRYYFLNGDEADYVGMARAYRAYLMKHQGATKLPESDVLASSESAPVLIRLFCADYESGLLGRTLRPMTTFEQAKTVIEALRAAGVSEMVVALEGWNRGGAHADLPQRLPAERALGGDRALKDLAEYLRTLGIPLILHDDYLVARGSKGGFNPRTQASRTAFNDVIEFRPESAPDQVGLSTGYLISPRHVMDFASRDLPKIAELGAAGIALKSLGSVLSSDQNKDIDPRLTRDRSATVAKELLALAQSLFPIVGVRTGNAYTLGLIDLVYHMPMECTRDIYMDESVPFYQIATHGLLVPFDKDRNLSSNPERDFLRGIEYGVLPCFVLTAEPSWRLRYTPSSHLFSTNYEDWIDEVSRQFQAVSAVLGPVLDQFIVGHRMVARGVYETTYEDGTAIVVNYTADTYIDDRVEVPARWFAVIRGGNR